MKLMLPRSRRTTIAISMDVLAGVAAFMAALYLRLGEGVFHLSATFFIQTTFLIAAAALAVVVASIVYSKRQSTSFGDNEAEAAISNLLFQ